MEGHWNLEAGEVLFVEGEPADFLYIIESGEVLLLKEDGKQVSPLSIVGPKGFIGELSAFSNRKTRSLSAVITQETSLLGVPIEDVQQVLKVCPDWVFEIMQVISGRLKASTDIMKEHRITSDEMENYAATHTQDLLQFKEKIERYRQKNGLNL